MGLTIDTIEFDRAGASTVPDLVWGGDDGVTVPPYGIAVPVPYSTNGSAGDGYRAEPIIPTLVQHRVPVMEKIQSAEANSMGAGAGVGTGDAKHTDKWVEPTIDTGSLIPTVVIPVTKRVF